jgi:hypothetical protein
MMTDVPVAVRVRIARNVVWPSFSVPILKR